MNHLTHKLDALTPPGALVGWPRWPELDDIDPALPTLLTGFRGNSEDRWTFLSLLANLSREDLAECFPELVYYYVTQR